MPLIPGDIRHLTLDAFECLFHRAKTAGTPVTVRPVDKRCQTLSDLLLVFDNGCSDD
jgi:hypothetical protein